MDGIEDFLALYNDANDYVASSRHRTFAENLRHWFAVIEENPVAGPLLYSFEHRVNFDEWLDAVSKTTDGSVGSGTLTWPESRGDVLALKLILLRGFSTNQIDVLRFGTDFYFGESGNFDATINSLVTQLFNQTAREFQRKVERAYREVNQGEAAMASDRVVKRSDNSEKFDEAIKSSDAVIEAFRANNSYENAQEKERLIAEIASGRDLLKAAEARWEAVRATIWTALKYLSKKTMDHAINILIASTLLLIAGIFGF